jgi:hypothetical protein
MSGLEGKYDYEGGILKKQGGKLILELRYRQNISNKPQKYLMREKSSGNEYVSSLYPEGGYYIMNDRRRTYVVSTGSTWVDIKKR